MSGPFDDLIPQKKPGALAPSKGFIYSPPADSLGQQQKAATLQETNLRNAKVAATAADDARKAKADADLAELNEQEKRQQLLLQNGVPAPGDTTKTGAEYIATLPPGMRPQVISMIEGRTPYPTGAALKNPQVMAIAAAAQQADPSYNYANAVTRLKTRQDFTSGPSAKNLTAINTALGHLGQLMTDAQELKNTGSPLVNTPLNAVRRDVLGSGKFSALQNDVLAVSAELERAFKGTNPTESGIHDWEKSFSPNSSPDQFLQGGQAVAKLLMGRLENLSDQYSRGMSRASDPMTLLNPHAQQVLQGITSGDLSKIPSTLPNGWDKAPLTATWLPGDMGPPPTPPASGGDVPPKVSPSAPGSLAPKADYSGMVGGPQANVATMDPNSKYGAFAQTYRNVYDPVMASALSAFIKKGAPYETVASFAQSHGFNPPDPQSYSAGVAYQKQYRNATPNVEADRSVPTTFGERIASSPFAAGIAAAGSGATAGLDDVVGRTIAGPQYDANRQALAALNPKADIVGNVLGGIAGSLAAPELLAKNAPGASKAIGAFSEAHPIIAPLAGNALYGGTYGATENPNDPVSGGLMGAITGAGAGYAGSKITRGLAAAIAPDVGNFGPLYEAGGFPTIGQRFGQSGFVGRALNIAEQAMQSMPGFGAAVARARDIPRDAAQIGAFNNALGDLAPFQAAGHDIPTALPPGTQPGTAPHAFISDAFNRAYPIARQGMQMVPGDDYRAATQAFTNKWFPLLNTEQQGQLSNLIRGSVTSRIANNGGMLPGSAYQQAASDIGDAAHAWSRSDPLLSQAASDFGGILDSAARASSDPQSVALLDAADKGYAKYAGVIRPASARVGGDPGEFTMKAFDRAVQNNAAGPDGSQYLRGNALMQDYANAIRPLGDVLSNSGTGERLLTNRLFLGEQAGAGALGAGLGGGSFLMAHPGALAPFAAYLPGANAAVTRLIAPRQYTLPPYLAQPLNLAGSKIDDIAPLIGTGIIPGALAYRNSQ